MYKARMRYPAEAMEELRREDPNTRVTLNLIRTLVKCDIVPAIRVGRGYLLNFDKLLEYLENPTEPTTTPAGIRPVRE